MRNKVGKALYVFLCSLMGIALFAIFHRSLAVIYTILLNSNYETFSFGLSDITLEAIDFFTLLMTLFAGGWYGTALGLHWYRIVYDGHVNVGMFHAIIPHHWRKARPIMRTATALVASASPSVRHTKEKPAKIVHVQQSPKRGIDSFESFKSATRRAPTVWELDDLETTIIEKENEVDASKTETVKPVARKKAVRKPRVAAKPAKAVTFEPEPEEPSKPVRSRKSATKAPAKRRTRVKAVTVTEPETV